MQKAMTRYEIRQKVVLATSRARTLIKWTHTIGSEDNSKSRDNSKCFCLQDVKKSVMNMAMILLMSLYQNSWFLRNGRPSKISLFSLTYSCCSVLEVFAAADVLCAHMCVARGAV